MKLSELKKHKDFIYEGKEVPLRKVKVGEIYKFDVTDNGGGGSGSQIFYSITGKVKEVNPEFIRVFKSSDSKQSYKIYNRAIRKVSQF